MTNYSLIKEFMATPGMILQHCNKQEYFKNELGATVLYAVDHNNKKALCSVDFENAKDRMHIDRYVPVYSHTQEHIDLFQAIAEDIKEAADERCDYVAEDGLLNYLTV